MTATVDDLILAELNRGWPYSTRVYAIRDVVGLHAPDASGVMCAECEMPDPCATKLTIARGLGVLGTEVTADGRWTWTPERR